MRGTVQSTLIGAGLSMALCGPAAGQAGPPPVASLEDVTACSLDGDMVFVVTGRDAAARRYKYPWDAAIDAFCNGKGFAIAAPAKAGRRRRPLAPTRRRRPPRQPPRAGGRRFPCRRETDLGQRPGAQGLGQGLQRRAAERPALAPRLQDQRLPVRQRQHRRRGLGAVARRGGAPVHPHARRCGSRATRCASSERGSTSSATTAK
jgi:hypothetical protein